MPMSHQVLDPVIQPYIITISIIHRLLQHEGFLEALLGCASSSGRYLQRCARNLQRHHRHERRDLAHQVAPFHRRCLGPLEPRLHGLVDTHRAWHAQRRRGGASSPPRPLSLALLELPPLCGMLSASKPMMTGSELSFRAACRPSPRRATQKPSRSIRRLDSTRRIGAPTKTFTRSST